MRDFLAIADVVPQPLLLVDGDGKVIAANAAAASVLGIEAGTTPDLGSLLRDAPERVRDLLRECRRTSSPIPFAVTPAQREPDDVWRGRGHAASAAGAGPGGIVMHLRPRREDVERFRALDQKIDQLTGEIRRRRSAEEQTAQALEREQVLRRSAEEASRAKDQFLATLSHELRTPLNAILGWTRILGSPDVDASVQVRALETIERNAKTQAQLIDDLLDIARIVSGKLRLDVQQVDLGAVVRAACDVVQPAADAKHLRLEVVIDPRAGPIAGDFDRLQQVVWNLLSNAVKFAPKEGRVALRVQRVNSHVDVTVADNGPGIPEEILPLVFDRFQQLDGSSTRMHRGLGLGLAIARELIELHGGSVRAANRSDGRGAVFTITLPVGAVHLPDPREAPVHPAASEPRPPASPWPDLSGARILVVEDDNDSRELLGTLLRRAGAEVTTAADVERAVLELERRRFDLLLSDVEMPGEDGYSLVQRIRSGSVGVDPDLPAAALTAYARTEDRMRALQAGFQHHIAKPVEPLELLTVIASLTRRLAPRV